MQMRGILVIPDKDIHSPALTLTPRGYPAVAPRADDSPAANPTTPSTPEFHARYPSEASLRQLLVPIAGEHSVSVVRIGMVRGAWASLLEERWDDKLRRGEGDRG